jgi:hypothetical protein
MPVADSTGKLREIHAFDLAGIQDNKIVAATVHLRKPHDADSSRYTQVEKSKNTVGNPPAFRIFLL